MFFGIVLIFLSPFIFAQNMGYKIEDNKGVAVIPFQKYNNLIIVEVRLNGILPLNFILDTGVKSVIITRKEFSDMLQVNYSMKLALQTPGNKEIIAYVTQNLKLDMPGVSGRGTGAFVLEEDYLNINNILGIEIHGIIGYDIFKDFIVEIHYPEEHLILYNHDEYRRGWFYYPVDIKIENEKPYLFANIIDDLNDTTQVKLLVDTGASHALLLLTDSTETFNLPNKMIENDLGVGLGGLIHGELGRLEGLTFDNFAFEEVLTSFIAREEYADSLNLNDRNGTLGGEILSRFRVVFDYKNEKMYLRKISKFKESFEYNMSGMDIKAKGDKLNEFVIFKVKEGSAADEAGVKEGDQIIKINGMHHSTLKLNEVFLLLTRKEGKKIRLKLLRDNKEIKIKFKLRRII